MKLNLVTGLPLTLLTFSAVSSALAADRTLYVHDGQLPGDLYSLKPLFHGDHSVPRSRAVVTVDSRRMSGSVPIVVVNGAAVSATLDSSELVVPPISNQKLDLGYLKFTSLFDNNLKLCGEAKNEKCGNAVIRMYTVGKPGEGLWNETDKWGAPILAGLPGMESLKVGLEAAGAAILQSNAIAGDKHVVRLSDFNPAPRYNVKADFTDAGAGNYETTLVLEYVLTK